jgi:hypothetical protein
MYSAIFRWFGGYGFDLVQSSSVGEIVLALCHIEVGFVQSGGGS